MFATTHSVSKSIPRTRSHQEFWTRYQTRSLSSASPRLTSSRSQVGEAPIHSLWSRSISDRGRYSFICKSTQTFSTLRCQFLGPVVCGHFCGLVAQGTNSAKSSGCCCVLSSARLAAALGTLGTRLLHPQLHFSSRGWCQA